MYNRLSSTNALANIEDQSFINKKLSEIIMQLNKRKIFDARVIVPDEGATSCRIIEACGKKFYIEFNSNHRITSVNRGINNSVDLSNRIWSSLKVSDIVEYILKECNFINKPFVKESMLKSKLIENLLK